ncbi:hypothetical protein Angca_001734, partial [Angiostrongylus cantonensis]
FATSAKPALLIGTKHFWNIVLPNDFHYKKLSNGYPLLHTTIGNIVICCRVNVRNFAATSIPTKKSTNPVERDKLSEWVSKF